MVATFFISFSLSLAIGNRFLPMMDDFWKYIKHAFTKL